MIKKLTGEQDGFVLLTDNTSYIIAIAPSGHPEHLYYGAKTDIDAFDELEALRQKREFEPGNTIVYSEEHPTTVLEDMCLECSGTGHGDIREPFIELVRADGTRTTDFLYQGCEISDIKPEITGLPGSYGKDDKVEHLCLSLADGALTLELHYCVYPACDVITRWAKLVNNDEESIELERLMSTQLDLPDSGWAVTSFHGAWAREMEKSTVAVPSGKYVIESRAGCSSNRCNPFFMLHRPAAVEDAEHARAAVRVFRQEGEGAGDGVDETSPGQPPACSLRRGVEPAGVVLRRDRHERRRVGARVDQIVHRRFRHRAGRAVSRRRRLQLDRPVTTIRIRVRPSAVAATGRNGPKIAPSCTGVSQAMATSPGGLRAASTNTVSSPVILSNPTML